MFITVNNAKLYFDVEGAGLVPDGPVMREKPTVIVLHGGPGADHSLSKPEFSSLADIAQVIYCDHRGNGRSEMCSNETWNLKQWGKDVRGLCDALGVEKPIVIGTSFGGFVAQSYATQYPDHPSKLILISTAAKMDFEAVYKMFGKLGGDEAEQIARDYWTAPTSKRRQKYRDICAPLYATNRSGSNDWVKRILFKDDTALWFNGPNNEHGRMDFRDNLKTITCPTLILAGDQDPIIPSQFSEEMAACISDDLVTYKQFENCGHGVVRDQTELAFDAIREFILGGS